MFRSPKGRADILRHKKRIGFSFLLMKLGGFLEKRKSKVGVRAVHTAWAFASSLFSGTPRPHQWIMQIVHVFLSGVALSLILNIYCYEDKIFYDDGAGCPADRG